MPDRVRQHGQRVPENQAGYREANTAFMRAEIRATRERMSDTLDELGTRLNPNRLKAQVKENVREATVGKVKNMAKNATDRVQDTGNGLMDKIRENPIPAAMVGIGLGWLLFGGRRRSEPMHALAGTAYVGDITATTPRLAQDDAAGGVGESISREPGMVDQVKDRVSDLGDTVRETTGDVTERARDLAHDVKDGTRQHAHAVSERFDQTLQENPMVIGAAALAIGVAAGLSIPETRRERELMGQYREKLVDRARDRFEETRDRVENVAERVVEEGKEVAREAAREEGLVG